MLRPLNAIYYVMILWASLQVCKDTLEKRACICFQPLGSGPGVGIQADKAPSDVSQSTGETSIVPSMRDVLCWPASLPCLHPRKIASGKIDMQSAFITAYCGLLKIDPSRAGQAKVNVMDGLVRRIPRLGSPAVRVRRCWNTSQLPRS